MENKPAENVTFSTPDKKFSDPVVLWFPFRYASNIEVKFFQLAGIRLLSLLRSIGAGYVGPRKSARLPVIHNGRRRRACGRRRSILEKLVFLTFWTLEIE